MKKITLFHKNLASKAFIGRPFVLETVNIFDDTKMEGIGMFMEDTPPSRKRVLIKIRYKIENHEIEVINVEEKPVS